jgi:3-deoxy-manno-octulosonate cytidylyltransferase (CMP-KDO synthetase)
MLQIRLLSHGKKTTAKYRAGILERWNDLILEQTEKLEQLRAMSNGVVIHIAQACEVPPAGIDTQQDLDRVRQLFGEVNED